MHSKVSVIVPAYKAESYLDLVVCDLINQTYENIEIIIVNDGSPDNCQNIIEKYVKKDARVVGVQIDNQGVSGARNKGLEMATGEYIRFVDADDRVPKDSIQLLVSEMEQDKEIDLVIGGYKDNTKRRLYTGKNLETQKVTIEYMLQEFVMYIRTFYYGVVWNKLYKREIIEKYQIRFEKGIEWSEDFLFNIEYFKRCGWIYYLNTKDIYEYNEHSGSLTASFDKQEDLEIRRKISYIDNLRRDRARKLLEQYGLERQFDLQWKYEMLYYQLLKLGKPTHKKSIIERYQNLKEILQNEEIKEYVVDKVSVNKDELIWRKIYNTIITKRYMRMFVFLCCRGFVVYYFYWLKPLWRIIKRGNEPKIF